MIWFVVTEFQEIYCRDFFHNMQTSWIVSEHITFPHVIRKTSHFWSEHLLNLAIELAVSELLSFIINTAPSANSQGWFVPEV